MTEQTKDVSHRSNERALCPQRSTSYKATLCGPGLQAHEALTFLPGQALHIARSMSSKPNTCPQDVPNKGGNVMHTLQWLCLPGSLREEI